MASGLGARRGLDIHGPNDRWAGTGDPPANSTDMWSVATHEAGHTYGLNHAAGNFLTIYDTNGRGCIRARDLGRGDMLVYDAMRPPPGS
ncbi:MAG: Matrixin [Solirubrobacterales bacterium]|nr:Matrixin [Solirubrobacterales bacterium]